MSDTVGAAPAQPPLAETVSPEARAALEPFLAAPPPPADMPIEQARQFAEMMGQAIGAARTARYGVAVDDQVMGGVPVKLICKEGCPATPDGALLINFHGGGFMVDAGSLAETIPIAALTGLPVAAVIYRLAPEHPYPAAVDDALAVYKDALQTRSPEQIAIFGTSAGAVLTIQLLARLKHDGLPMPAAAGCFSGSGDLALISDIERYLPTLMEGKYGPEVIAPYAGDVDRRDPLLSPLYGDLSGLPPVLLMTSTRDLLLSQTARLHLALRAAGVAADLLVYEGMPHAFWSYVECPETEAALAAQSEFLAGHVSARPLRDA